MPIDYKNYPHNWKTQIRPDILARDENRCAFCQVPNGIAVFRGWYNSQEVYQNIEGQIFDADTGNYIADGVVEFVTPLHGDPNQRAIKIVLTIAHIDHDVSNNDYGNLKALCQRCHNRHDKEHRKANAEVTRNNKKGIQNLFA